MVYERGLDSRTVCGPGCTRFRRASGEHVLNILRRLNAPVEMRAVTVTKLLLTEEPTADSSRHGARVLSCRRIPLSNDIIAQINGTNQSWRFKISSPKTRTTRKNAASGANIEGLSIR